MTSKYKGRSLVSGSTSGEALTSRRAFTFAHGVDPRTGKVTDVRSEMLGSNVSARVLVYPFGKGSTTGSSWFLETVRLENGPAAILTESPDLTAVIGSVMAGILYKKVIPVLCGMPPEFYSRVKTGDALKVEDGDVEVL